SRAPATLDFPPNLPTLMAVRPYSLSDPLRPASRLSASPPGAVLMHHPEQDALAQAAIGDAHTIARESPADRLEDGAARQHEIGAFATDTGIGCASGIVHFDQLVDDRQDVFLTHP